MNTENKEDELINLPDQPWFTTSEVIEYTKWSRYFLRCLEDAGTLNPYRYKATAQRRYSRTDILKVFQS